MELLQVFSQSSKGLKQGDPLSPYLFILVVEILSQLLLKAKCGGFISGFKMGRRSGEGRDGSHLLFADNTLIFCEANSDQLRYLGWVFMWFRALSGFKVNMDKSKVILVGRVETLENFALMTGCRVGKLSTSYLGLSLNALFKFPRVGDVVEKRSRKRLTIWKGQYLSKGGRLTLIKSTLSCLLIYFMSLFFIPEKVCARLEKIQRDFLWVGGALEKRPHLVNWNLVCVDKEGGLGIHSLAALLL